MSADLQFRLQDLRPVTPVQLPSLELNIPPSDNESTDESCIIQSEEEVDICVTPTSLEHRIPTVLSCPPPPKKQRRTARACKRRISEFEFFEAVARDEIDSFFKSSFEFIESKRRRCSL
ncbi:cyclin-dependent protein kinase inhibitor SMR2-like [Bidens hawaiensis]|uniref:cyclin-dependent protein kinase inhibitor SMR2-like n=1 Tax=Bidens hawaiensis TaxID=980011 RepID=UPI0040491755